MTGIPGAGDRIVAEATSWPGVDTAIGSRGELSIRYESREIGHLHGDRVAHLGFPKAVWQELYDAGRIDYHSAFPGKKGWAARSITDEDDVHDVIALLRLNYDRVVTTHGVPA